MRVDVLTLFPQAFSGPLDVSILRRAREQGLLDLHLHNIRDHGEGRHRSADDYPFGGGQGMVMRVDVLVRALDAVRAQDDLPAHVIYLSPQGQRLDDRLARELARERRLILVCGRYEGVDERFLEHCVDREVSAGDFIVTGGELPAMLLIDAVTRHIPGALGDAESSQDESFADGLLEHPQYTRPADYGDWPVPPVLLGGDHAKIARWQREQRLTRTAKRRPDLAPAAPGSERPAFKAAGARIRTGEANDLEAVLALWASAGPGIRLGISDTLPELQRKLTRDPDLFLVAHAGKRLVGAVMGGWDGRRGHVYHLAVARQARGNGLGAAIMAELEARFRLKGCSRLNLLVAPEGATALDFYGRLGWQPTGATSFGKDL